MPTTPEGLVAMLKHLEPLFNETMAEDYADGRASNLWKTLIKFATVQGETRARTRVQGLTEIDTVTASVARVVEQYSKARSLQRISVDELAAAEQAEWAAKKAGRHHVAESAAHEQADQADTAASEGEIAAFHALLDCKALTSKRVKPRDLTLWLGAVLSSPLLNDECCDLEPEDVAKIIARTNTALTNILAR
jgi:hypothetical protein